MRRNGFSICILLADIRLPETRANDLEDIPAEGVPLSAWRRNEFLHIKKHGKWKEAIRAYLASISFADAQLGRVLDALEQSLHHRNTIIVFWSDHGWHLGEKITGTKARSGGGYTYSVSHLRTGRDARQYKLLAAGGYAQHLSTLLELCGLKPVAGLDGPSLVPLLKNPDGPWATPAIRNFSAANAPCVRTGIVTFGMLTAPELYDHMRDPQEWTNIAGVEASRPVIAELARWIPKHFAPNAPWGRPI